MNNNGQDTYNIEVELAVVVTKLDEIGKTLSHIDKIIERQESRLDNVEHFTKTSKTIIKILSWLLPLTMAFTPIVFSLYIDAIVQQQVKEALEERGL
jgi:hypothetical protein